MSLTDFNLYSSIECSTIASFPSSSILDLESFKSKRVCTSFDACWMALDTSSRSILLTMSKVFSGMSVAPSEVDENVTSEVIRRSAFNAAVLWGRRVSLFLEDGGHRRPSTGHCPAGDVARLPSLLWFGFCQFEKRVKVGSSLSADVVRRKPP